MRSATPFLLAAFFCSGVSLPTQEPPASPPPAAGEPSSGGSAAADAENHSLLERVIANQKRNEAEQWSYEHIERLEIRKGTGAAQDPEVKVTRMIPAGTGIGRIPVETDGRPTDPSAYRADLEKLERTLSWASEEGRAQREAYEKIAKKQKERSELLDAARNAFIFTFVRRETRGDRLLAKYYMAPNPAFKPTSRATSIFMKVRGYLWIDEQAAQLARAEIEVTEDISIGGFLARIYKGSHLMQERYEMAPGVWLPTYSQYDFDGRRLFVTFAIHEHTYYSQYRRIGPPKEALQAIRAELGKSSSANVAPPSKSFIANTTASAAQQ